MRVRSVVVAWVGLALMVAGCTSNQVGPIRPITIADDVAYTRPLAEPDLSTFYGAPPATLAAVRNQIVTARMYIADIQYHYYEARLTREMQEEGLGATLATLGLTTASTLVGSAGTKTILSGAATAVVGADKAYNEKLLLSNTIQALQSQMRADRKTQAAVIYAKMFKEVGNNTKTITPIFEYTLPMALSDADNYYQAGTIASALIGLSKTVANAEQNADQAKSQAGPNPAAVSDAKITAAPIAEPLMPPVGTGPSVVGPRPSPSPTPPRPSTSELQVLQNKFTAAQIKLQDLKLALATDLPAQLAEAKTKLAAMPPGSAQATAQTKAIDVISDQIATKIPKQIEAQKQVIEGLKSQAANLGGTLQ